MHPSTLAQGPPTGRRPAGPRSAAELAGYLLARRWVTWCAVVALLLAGAGLVVGLLVAPTDKRQGDAYRIAFIHIPLVWISALTFATLAFWTTLGLLARLRVASLFAAALAPTGALMTFVALWTAALWAKPTVGAWWTWDVRLTAELLLFVTYLVFIGLRSVDPDLRRAERRSAIVAIIGLVNLPIITLSSPPWSSLQTDASMGLSGVTLTGVILMATACSAYALAATLHRAGSMLLEQASSDIWLQQFERSTP